MRKFSFAIIVTSLALLLLAILSSAGCATKWKAYPGTELPKDKIAIILPDEALKTAFTGSIAIPKVDGKGAEKARVSSAIEVLPGEHTIEVRLLPSPFEPGGILGFKVYRKHLTFIAEAGHVYIVCGKREITGGKRRWVWIVDKKTNEVVAGEKPE